jgi:hypothetical protein
LKAAALYATRARFAEILVDDLHAAVRPSESNGAIDQPVLQRRALLVQPHLVER